MRRHYRLRPGEIQVMLQLLNMARQREGLTPQQVELMGSDGGEVVNDLVYPTKIRFLGAVVEYEEP